MKSREEITLLLKEELRAISLHSGDVYDIDSQIDVVVVEDYDKHFNRAVDRIVAILLSEPVPERLPDEVEDEAEDD